MAKTLVTCKMSNAYIQPHGSNIASKDHKLEKMIIW